MSRAYWWPTVLILSTVLVLLSQKVFIPVVSPLVMAWFFLVCPGLALVGLLPRATVSIQVGLTFALSIAFNTILAEIMAFAHLWSPNTALFLLVCLTVSCAILQLLRIALDGEAPADLDKQENGRLSEPTASFATPHLLEHQAVDHVALSRQASEQAGAQRQSVQPHFVEQLYFLPKRHLAVNRSGERIASKELRDSR